MLRNISFNVKIFLHVWNGIHDFLKGNFTRTRGIRSFSFIYHSSLFSTFFYKRIKCGKKKWQKDKKKFNRLPAWYFLVNLFRKQRTRIIKRYRFSKDFLIHKYIKYNNNNNNNCNDNDNNSYNKIWKDIAYEYYYIV